MTTSKRGQTKFDRAWTRYNCLTKGIEVPDWARESTEIDWMTNLIEKHNAEVRTDGRRNNTKNSVSERKRTDGKRT
jgi:hypothetical protein